MLRPAINARITTIAHLDTALPTSTRTVSSLPSPTKEKERAKARAKEKEKVKGARKRKAKVKESVPEAKTSMKKSEITTTNTTKTTGSEKASG